MFHGHEITSSCYVSSTTPQHRSSSTPCLSQSGYSNKNIILSQSGYGNKNTIFFQSVKTEMYKSSK